MNMLIAGRSDSLFELIRIVRAKSHKVNRNCEAKVLPGTIVVALHDTLVTGWL